ncbi:MAG: DegT/DnrJ/EryC1/StrS family aminotransferase, partial [Candidatus Omnitrophica bacterium]|nr:DegT/DnrJ/EryC1/StrS family aminotransferase [Candidatus Omnitrophota bacterium]
MTSKSSGSSTEAKIPLLDLQAQYLALEPEILNAVKSVLRGGHYILGDEVRTLESEMAALCGTTCGIGVASGSDALELALRALGVGPGDEVITTP